MAENSAISWTDHTFNGWVGCTKVSPACDHCYAENLMDTRLHRAKWGSPGVRSQLVRTSAANWKLPLRWNAQAATARTRPFVFCNSLSDVFDNDAPAEWRRDLIELWHATPNLIWLALTKRPQMILKLFRDEVCQGMILRKLMGEIWPWNVAIGTTVEDLERRRNLDSLLQAAATLKPAFTFVSVEPALEWFTLNPYFEPHVRPGLDWVITGGETDQGGPNARPADMSWFARWRDECRAAGVAYHHKQNGEFLTFDVAAPGMTAHRVVVGGRIYGPEKMHDLGESRVAVKVGKAVAGRMFGSQTYDARPEVRSW